MLKSEKDIFIFLCDLVLIFLLHGEYMLGSAGHGPVLLGGAGGDKDL